LDSEGDRIVEEGEVGSREGDKGSVEEGVEVETEFEIGWGEETSTEKVAEDEGEEDEKEVDNTVEEKEEGVDDVEREEVEDRANKADDNDEEKGIDVEEANSVG
jgi:hypothetical protein